MISKRIIVLILSIFLTVTSNLLGRNFNPDIIIQLTAKPKIVKILENKNTAVWSYASKLLKGSRHNLSTIPNSYLGPIIRAKTGQKIRIIYKNEIPEVSIIHWHGMHVPAVMDGHPKYVISTGKTYTYEFEIKNRAGTYWFHPHPNKITGEQVYKGLAGLFIVEDNNEKRLNLPSGEYDIPLVIQDRTFNDDGSLKYINLSASTGMMGMMGGMNMEMMRGFLGDTILVNGHKNFLLKVKTAKYRVRLLNGSNSRIYKLYLSNNKNFIVIGTDGGLLERPIKKRFITLAPAQRVEVILDFSKNKVNDIVQIRSAQFEAGSVRGMMGMMRRMFTLRSGDKDFLIMAFKVKKRVKLHQTIPDSLSVIKRIKEKEAINYRHPRKFVFSMMHMQFTINGRTFEMNKVADDEKVKLNTTEIWQLVNSGMMPHPIHIHNVQFQVISRTTKRNDIKDGYIDSGWKDTILLLPGEAAKVIMRFKDYTGIYLYHCHNLEHEDLGMMRNFEIVK